MIKGRFIGRISRVPDDNVGMINLRNLIERGYETRVFLGGVPQPNMLAADSNEGWVRLRCWNRVPGGGSVLTVIELKGSVEICIEKPSRRAAQIRRGDGKGPSWPPLPSCSIAR